MRDIQAGKESKMKNRWDKIIEQLRDDQYTGIEYLLTHVIFALWMLIVLIVIGFIFGG